MGANPTFTGNCPRCEAAKITFDASGRNYLGFNSYVERHQFEVLVVCRNCGRSSIVVIETREKSFKLNTSSEQFWNSQPHLNDHFYTLSFLSKKDNFVVSCPENVPPEIESIYSEGEACVSIQCWNAAGAMFRLCVDRCTEPLLPDQNGENGGPNRHQRSNLKARIEWLLETDLIPSDLSELLENLREDGNDAVHVGALTQVDAEDLRDFARELLNRLYTQPAKIRRAKERRIERRAPKAD